MNDSSSITPPYMAGLHSSARLPISSTHDTASDPQASMNYNGRAFPGWSAGLGTGGDTMPQYDDGQLTSSWPSDSFAAQARAHAPAGDDSFSFANHSDRHSLEQQHQQAQAQLQAYHQVHSRISSMGYTESSPAVESRTPDGSIGHYTTSTSYYSPPYQTQAVSQRLMHARQPRQLEPLQPHQAQAIAAMQAAIPLLPPVTTPASVATSRPSSTLWFGDLEPWMDIDWFNNLCSLMGWENVIIKMPQPNTTGHCFLTFPSPSYAASVLAQFETRPLMMPGTKKSFNVNWATVSGDGTNGLGASLRPNSDKTGPNNVPGNGNIFNGGPEYSIFVGDLAPETTNADLIAVFRDPTLGLRSDREPRFIRPFTSCKSAKIMVDPVTGVSKGYGFVRFGEEVDQQRALIEMQGLYCLSRPMRISQATAKSKAQNQQQPAPLALSTSQPLFSQPGSLQLLPDTDFLIKERGNLSSPTSMTPYSHGFQGFDAGLGRQIVSPNASTPTTSPQTHYAHEEVSSAKARDRSSSGELKAAMSCLPPAAVQALTTLNLGHDALVQIAKIAGAAIGASPDMRRDSVGSADGSGRTMQQGSSSIPSASSDLSSEERIYQARALLANMIGPNGGVLNSTDPYNTTVFVGGLSGLISEDTLRTFFRPYGEIHYVKVPPGKGCGFVQFVRKADAERAIERMQGFPIGGGRVRLSWGRSQSDKAAQAAAQAAQLGLNLGQLGSLQGLSAAHTAHLLQALGLNGALPGSGSDSPHPNSSTPSSSTSPPRVSDAYDQRFVGHSLSTPSSDTDLSSVRSNNLRDVPFQTFYQVDSQSPRPSADSGMSRSFNYPGFSPFGVEATPSQQTSAGTGSIPKVFSDDMAGGNYFQSQKGITSIGLTRSSSGFDNVLDNRPVSPTDVTGVGASRQRSLTSSRGAGSAFGSYGFFEGAGGGISPDPRTNASTFNVSDLLIRQERSGSDSTTTTTTSTTSQGTTTNTASSTPPSQFRGPQDIFNLSDGFSSLSFGNGQGSQSVAGKDGRRSSGGLRGFTESDSASNI